MPDCAQRQMPHGAIRVYAVIPNRPRCGRVRNLLFVFTWNAIRSYAVAGRVLISGEL